MTEQLEKAWKASSKPFHNETIYTEDLVPIGALQAFVNSIVRHIELYYSGNSLFVFDDWHAHDGFIVPAAALSIRELADKVTTADSLYKWRQGDFEVYRSIYPDTLDFLLRVNILDGDDDPEQYPGIWGSMSFTGYGFDLAEIGKRGHGVASNWHEPNQKSILTKSMPDSTPRHARANKTLETNCRPASPLAAWRQFGRAVHAPACVSSGSRSALRSP